MEMVCEPRELEDSETADGPVLPVCEARVIERVVLGRAILGSGRVLFRDMLVIEIWFVKRREEPDSEE